MLFYIITVIAVAIDAKECVVSREGQCVLASCGEWCLQAYKGHGTCVSGSGDPSSYKCDCVYNCST